MVCVAWSQLYQCCHLPDGPLNHLKLLKYHGNFCKCRNAQHNTVARFQLTMLHPPCSFALLHSSALFLSSCTPEAAARAPAVPRTLWALQSKVFAWAQVLITVHYKALLNSLSLCRYWSPANPSTHYKWGTSGEKAPFGQEAQQCQVHLPQGAFQPWKHGRKTAFTCQKEPAVPCETVKQKQWSFALRDWE